MKVARHPSLLSAMLLLALVSGWFAAAPVRPATAQVATCGPMDVAFIIDDTGSMGGAINNVKAELTAIFADITAASGGDYQLALVAFKDNIVVHNNFAPANAAPVGVNLNLLVAGGGAGEPEASDEALNTVVNALPAAGRPQNIDFTPAFRPAALKIAILVTDARPGGFDDAYTAGVDDTAAALRASQAAALGIKISAVHVPSPFGPAFDAQIAPIMQNYATTTGGAYKLTNADGSGTGQAVKDIIAACGSGTGPDLVITKEPKPGQPPAVPGGTFAYIIRVKNIGNRATPPPPIDVTMRDDISAAGTFVSWTANAGRCTNNSPFIDCRRGRMAPGEEWWIEIKVRIRPNACSITNRAQADFWNRIVELNEANNSASLTTPVVNPACVIP